MKPRALVRAILSIGALAILLGACVPLQQRQQLPTPGERGHSPWVFRSVLDRHPRMITFALSPSLWAAYDTQTASLYKVWRDGVDFEGAVYTTRHGPQPTSKGPSYIVNDLENPWRVRLGGREHVPKVQYLGHRFHDGPAAIRYALLFGDGERIEIEEWPEVEFRPDGRTSFFRRYDILANESGAKVVLMTSVQSLLAAEDIDTNGEWVVHDSTRGERALAVRGELTRQAKTTRFVTTFAPEPALPPPLAEETLRPAVAIMERSDCNVCHNPTQQTIGPSYTQIARRYKTTDHNIEALAQKIITGGSGAWGDVPMTPHPEMSLEDARTLAAYILSFDEDDAHGVEIATATGAAGHVARTLPPGFEPGVTLKYYEIADDVAGVPVIVEGQQPSKVSVVPHVLLTMNPSRPGEYGFEDFQHKRKFVIHATGMIEIRRPGVYRFRIDDGSGDARLFIGARKVIETQA